MAGTRTRTTRLLRGLVCLLAVSVGVTLGLSPLPAHADDVVTIDLSGFTGQIVYSDGASGPLLTLPSQEGGVQVASQCFDTSFTPSTDPTKGCLGMATQTDLPPLDVGGIENLFPLFKSERAEGALGWMVADARQELRAIYDIPDDDRLGKWGRAELRAQLVEGLLHIMDKRAYGIELSSDEQRALTFVEQEYLEQDRFIAEKAYEEYLVFKASPCTYTVPEAPRVVTDPETVPKRVTDWCKSHVGQVATSFTIAPPLPTAAQFRTWATYRYADRVGLAAFDDPVVQNNLIGMAVGTATAAGFALAAAAGGTAYYLATVTSLASSLGAKLFPHLTRVAFAENATWVTKVAAHGAAKMATAWAGAIAAAFIAIVVIVALVVVGVATYLVVQHESVAATLNDTIDTAKKASDPFGLDPLTEKLAGKPLNSVIFVDPPAYRTDASQAKLAANVMLWTTVVDRESPPPGPLPGNGIVADPGGIWPGSEPTASDPQWVVRVGDRDPVLRTSFSVPQQRGNRTLYTTISRSRDWLVVKEPLTPVRPALSFGYLNEDGEPRLAHRAPSAVGGFIVTDPSVGGGGSQEPAITFRNEAGQLVRVRTQRRALEYLDGPRPVAVGSLTSDEPVELAPNPVGQDGASLEVSDFEDDYTFDWTVERLDPQSGEWSVVHTASGSGTAFVPSDPGEYDARVTMTAVGDPTAQKHGSVRFTVTPPPLTAPVMALEDDGDSRLEVDLQMRSGTTADDLRVDVTWPGQLGSSQDPTSSVELSCSQADDASCLSPRTGPSDLLVHELSPAVDLRRPVRVVVTSGEGAVLQQEFILGARRPSVATVPAGGNSDEPGIVVVGKNVVDVEMPLAEQVQDYDVRLVPGAGGGQGFGLVDPVTGNTAGVIELPGTDDMFASVYQDGADWFLEVRGTPQLKDLGTYEAPVLVDQTNGTRQLVLVTVHVVPTTGDRFRGGLQTDIDRRDFAVDELPLLEPSILGGKIGTPRYRGEMCVSLQRRDFGAPPVVKCRDSSEFLGPDGTARPFPFAQLFPQGMPRGTYSAETWLSTSREDVDNEPLGVGFFLTEDASWPTPPVELTSVAVTGKPRVRRKVSAAVGATYPDRAELRYRWLRDGKAVRGATAATYRVVRGDRGHRLSVKVVATSPGYARAVLVSPRTARVRR